jgi:hypothetical protein
MNRYVQRRLLAAMLIHGGTRVFRYEHDGRLVAQSLVELGYLEEIGYGPDLRCRITPEGVLALIDSSDIPATPTVEPPLRKVEAA